MAKKQPALPDRFPEGSTYVVECRGSIQGMMLVHRYVRFPDGRVFELMARLVPTCGRQQRATAAGDRMLAARIRASRGARVADEIR